jgi:hypothetical protein
MSGEFSGMFKRCVGCGNHLNTGPLATQPVRIDEDDCMLAEVVDIAKNNPYFMCRGCADDPGSRAFATMCAIHDWGIIYFDNNQERVRKAGRHYR